jgi:hypothetical protein
VINFTSAFSHLIILVERSPVFFFAFLSFFSSRLLFDYIYDVVDDYDGGDYDEKEQLLLTEDHHRV